MAQVVLFHHVQGLTEGVEAFADQLRAAGHGVVVPDRAHLFTDRSLDDHDPQAAHLVLDRTLDVLSRIG